MTDFFSMHNEMHDSIFYDLTLTKLQLYSLVTGKLNPPASEGVKTKSRFLPQIKSSATFSASRTGVGRTMSFCPEQYDWPHHVQLSTS